jgi:hypothetical protein
VLAHNQREGYTRNQSGDAVMAASVSQAAFYDLTTQTQLPLLPLNPNAMLLSRYQK